MELRRATFTDMETKDIGEAMYLSNHNFDVEMQPLVMPNGHTIWDKKAVIRTDNGAYLGTVGRKVNHIQPKNFYAMAQSLMDATGGLITKGITLSNGSVIGLVFTLDRAEYISGDVITHSFIMLTSYDSSYAILGRAITDRFFCLNQMGASSKLFSIKNTSGNLEKLEMATRMLGYYGDEMKTFDQKMKLLTSHQMSDTRAIDWFGSLFTQPTEKSSPRSISLFTNTVETFTDLLENGLGTGHNGVRGSAYGAWNAMTEYANHHRHTRVAEGKQEDQVRFESTLLGGSADRFMTSGFESLVKIADTVPSGSIV